MNRRILICALMSALLLLSGCRLALPEAGPESAEDYGFEHIYWDSLLPDSPQGDRMAGVFITRSYLDPGSDDIMAYLRENVETRKDEDVITLPETGIDRIYAVQTDHAYEFPGIDGILLGSFRMRSDPTDPDSSFWGSAATNGASDVHIGYTSGDNTSEVAISATIYMPYTLGEVSFFFNPVYQTDDGSVYMLPGTGTSWNTHHSGNTSESLKEQSVYYENGEAIHYTIAIDVETVCITPPTAITYIQMDANHQVLTMDTYKPGLLPEEITPRRDTAYILIEETQGGNIVNTVVSPGFDTIEAFYCLENDLCVKDCTKVLWPENP